MKLRSIALVARFELWDAIRSKKALALLILYLTASLAGTALFIRTVEAIEGALADTLAVSHTAQAGTMTSTLFQSDQFRRILEGMVGNGPLAAKLVSIPPLALFYGAFALGLVPLLVVLSASDTIALEVSTGAVRYSLFRCDRLSYALGKFFGQVGLMVVGVFTGALASTVLGALSFASFNAWSTIQWMFVLSLRTCFFGFAFLGVAFLVSQLTASVNLARAGGIMLWFFLTVGHHLLDVEKVRAWAPVLVPSVQEIFPGAHRLDLWRPEFLPRFSAEVMLLGLGAGFFSLGYLRFARRDG